MKTTIISIALAVAATSLAAPTQKRAPVGTINLYTDNDYKGLKHTVNIDFAPFEEGFGCMAYTLPSNIDNKVSSLDFTGDTSTFNCRLVDQPNCVFGDDNRNQTWTINTPVPNLSVYGTGEGSDYPGFDDLTSSLWCASVTQPSK